MGGVRGGVMIPRVIGRGAQWGTRLRVTGWRAESLNFGGFVLFLHLFFVLLIMVLLLVVGFGDRVY